MTSSRLRTERDLLDDGQLGIARPSGDLPAADSRKDHVRGLESTLTVVLKVRPERRRRPIDTRAFQLKLSNHSVGTPPWKLLIDRSVRGRIVWRPDDCPLQDRVELAVPMMERIWFVAGWRASIRDRDRAWPLGSNGCIRRGGDEAGVATGQHRREGDHDADEAQPIPREPHHRQRVGVFHSRVKWTLSRLSAPSVDVWSGSWCSGPGRAMGSPSGPLDAPRGRTVATGVPATLAPMRSFRTFQVVLGVTLAMLASFGMASAVSAECDPQTLPTRQIADYRGLLFAATVASISDQPTRVPTPGAPYDTEVTLDVSRIYRGPVDDPLLVDGWDAGCGLLRIDGLHVGDTLLVSIGGKDPLSHPTIDGPVLVWHRVDDRWQFYEPALQYADQGPDFYPAAAREATTTISIVRLLGSRTAPDTGVAATTTTAPTPLPLGLLLVAAAFGAAATLYRLRSPERSR